MSEITLEVENMPGIEANFEFEPTGLKNWNSADKILLNLMIYIYW